MQGNEQIRFSELFADTVSTFGRAWAFMYYVVKHGMAEWEFEFWMKAISR